MTLEMSQFHEAFFEEAFESLDAMEAGLLQLDPGAPNAETINAVFRVAHSIKGGSGMFGFTEITSFTHTLETLLDELRTGRMPVSSGTVDLLLKSSDVLRGMLKATQRATPIDQQTVADLQFDLEQLVTQRASARAAPAAPTRWRIDFQPGPALLQRGNDPMSMIAALTELGALERSVDTHAVPPLADLDPECCHLAWTFELTGATDEDAIRKVFDWADGDCTLAITALTAAAPATATAKAAHAATASTAPTATPSATDPASKTAPATTNAPPSQSRPAAAAGGSDSNSIRVGIEKIDELMNTVGEMVITQSMLMQFAHGSEPLQMDRLRNGLTQLERNVRELQETVMRVRMLPMSFAFSRFPRLVRDLAQRLGKKIELRMTGEQTELDKTVLERIGDPLVHLVRNSIDHGIESPEVRLAAGKSATGTVYLNAFHRGGSIVVEVGDDGAGLKLDRILAKARAKGLVGANDALSDDAIADLIFLPGFTTADQPTDLSGRGVGMDVVRRNVKDLGGKIDLRTEPGRGSSFAISLPLTLAIVDGQSVAVGEETYIVPLLAIVESLQLKADMVRRLVGRGEVFSFRGDYIPLIRLHQVFDVQPRQREIENGIVMVVEGDGGKVGLFVDKLLGQQQVVIKSLETNYRRVDGVSGATILGEGSVALILDVPGLIRVADQQAAA